MHKVPFSIYRYSSYPEYFQDAYEAIHSQDESFSYDRIARLADLKSRTLARNLIKGIQKPTLAQLKKLCLCFGLDGEEQEYAACLYQFQSVESSAASFELFQRLARLQKQRLPEIDPFKDIEIATSVLHMTLLTLFGLANPPRDLAGVTAALQGRYSESEVAGAIRDLETLRYVERRGDQWELLQKHIKNYDVKANPFLRQYHDQCLRIAGEALHQGGTDDRYLIGASFAINQKVYPRIIQKLNAFMENLMQLEGVAGGADTVVQVSTQLVKMTAPLLLFLMSAGASAQMPVTDAFDRGIALFGEGGVQGGGGDPGLEKRIQDIRDDLYGFVMTGGAAQFDYTGARVTREEYENGNGARKIISMRKVLARGAVTVRVIVKQDFTSEIGNTYVSTLARDGKKIRQKKTCKGVPEFGERKLAYLVCEKAAFEAMTRGKTAEQKQDLEFQLIHHEYASLAGIETNIDLASDWTFSKQVVRFFGSRIIRTVMARAGTSYRPMEWVKIPGASVTEELEMSKFPVTQAQWFDVMEHNPSFFQGPGHCPENYTDDRGGYCPDHPVEQVTWSQICGAPGATFIKREYDARRKRDLDHFSAPDYQLGPDQCGSNGVGFVQRLNAKNDGWHYRLPTSAEWEFAARAGDPGDYLGGNTEAGVRLYSWFFGDPQGRGDLPAPEIDAHYGFTQPVGRKKPNAFGLYDMIGNVAHWVYDAVLVCDPEKLARGESECWYQRVVRGAAVTSRVADIRFDHWWSLPAAGRPDPNDSEKRVGYADVGFRLVRTRAKR